MSGFWAGMMSQPTGRTGVSAVEDPQRRLAEIDQQLAKTGRQIDRTVLILIGIDMFMGALALGLAAYQAVLGRPIAWGLGVAWLVLLALACVMNIVSQFTIRSLRTQVRELQASQRAARHGGRAIDPRRNYR